MISKLRHRRLLQFLEERKEVTIESLAEELNISSATVRRDLKELNDLGLVRRLQGGAVAVSSVSKEAPFSVRETEHSREKKLIARYAANFVKDGDVLFLDGGTTTEFLIPEIADKKGLTVITCGINIASSLTRYPSIHGIMLGGEIHADSQTVVGLISQRLFDSFNVRCDIAFIATAGVDAVGGATNRMIDRIPLKQRGMQISSQSILLADGSKFGRVSFCKIAEVEDFAYIITSASAPLKETEAIQARGGNVLIAYDQDEA